MDFGSLAFVHAGNWSAALRFAPAKRKKPVANTNAKPVALRNAFADTDDTATSPAVAPRIVGRAKAALITSAADTPSATAAPASASTSKVDIMHKHQVIAPAPSVHPRAARVGRVIPKPPPMTLDDDDVSTSLQSRATRNDNRGSRKKGKRKEDPALQFGDTPYDPARPCDYVCLGMYSARNYRASPCLRSVAEQAWANALSTTAHSLYAELMCRIFSPHIRLMFRLYVLNGD